MIWKPRDPIYYEKAKQILADYYAMNSDLGSVSGKWSLSERMVRHYLTLMGVVLPPRVRDKMGRYLPAVKRGDK